MPLAVGDRLGPYEVLARISTGGMGDVYRARDTRLDRIVAVKTAKDQFSERFEREARAIASLNHPNICTLHDVGPNYLVMEYIEGAPIKAPLPVDRVCPLAIQIADALDAAHSKGIVHRDLKPANVLITRGDRVKILDFGLALIGSLRARTADETLTMSTTDPGTAVGTVAYMSPEQARGQALDARTDLWSFGVMLYELATGTRPFDGATIALTFESILHHTPAPVHERNPKVPAELERIIGRLLEKDRETRYQSAADLRADLRKAGRDSSGGVPVAAPAQPNRVAKWKIATAAVGAVTLAAAGGIYLWQRVDAAPLTDKDVLVLADFTNTTGDAVFDGTLREALAIGLEESPFLKIMDDAEVTQTLRLMGRSAKDHITNDIAHEICIRTGQKATIGGSIASLGKSYAITLVAANCQTGATLARQQSEALDKEHVLKAVGAAAASVRAKLGESLRSVQANNPLGGDPRVTTTSLEAFQAYAQARERANQGSYLEAISLYQRATDLDPNFATAYASESGMYSNLGQRQRSEELLKKAFSLIDRVSEGERLAISGTYYWRVNGELDKAIDIFLQQARDYPRSSSPHNQLGIIHSFMGDWEKALQEFQEALRLSPWSSGLYANVIQAFHGLGRFDEGKAVAEQAFARKLDAATIHLRLLMIAYDQGDASAAQKEIQWMVGKPQEFQGLQIQANNALVQGRGRQGISLYQQPANLMRRRGLKLPTYIEVITAYVPATFGNCGPLHALGFARAVPAAADDPDAAIDSAFWPTLCGETAPAGKLAEEAAKLRPLDTLHNGLYLPKLRAAIELGRNQPEKAVEFLKPAKQYPDRSAIYLRGLAYLRAKKGPEAEIEFQKILDFKDLNTIGWWRPVAHVGLARAATLAGEPVKAKKAFQDFFALWKDADPDIPLLIEARKEYAALE